MSISEHNLAENLYKNGNFKEAFDIYFNLAKSGDAKSQTSLGYLFQNGEGVEKDIEQAKFWYEEAVKQEYPMSFYNLGVLYLNSANNSQDEKTAFQLFLKSAILEIPQGQFETAYMLEEGVGCDQSFPESAFWYEESAKRGNLEAFNNLGVLFRDGLGVDKSYEKAVHLFKRSADAGNSSAMYNLGFCFDNGFGVEKNSDMALEYLRKASLQGNEKANQMLEKLRDKGDFAF